MKFSAIMFTTTVSFIDRLHSISYFKLHLLFLTENQQHISLKHSHIDKGSCASNYWKPSAEILSSWYQFSQSCSDIMVICYILKLWSVQTLGHCTVRFTITECRFWVAPKEKKALNIVVLAIRSQPIMHMGRSLFFISELYYWNTFCVVSKLLWTWATITFWFFLDFVHGESHRTKSWWGKISHSFIKRAVFQLPPQ